MKFKDLLFSFFQGFFRWMGAGFALFMIAALFMAIGNLSQGPKAVALPTHGFCKAQWKGEPAIALLRIDGEIGTPQLNAERWRESLEACQSDELKGKIHAILLEINSPGGLAKDSEEIYALLIAYKELYKVPVYAYVNGVCASGGYMIACAADQIVSADYSTIGSVGIIAKMVNYSGAFDKLGLQSYTFSRGEGKDILDPARPFSESDRDFLNPLLDGGYNRFLAMVSRSRPLLTDKVLREEVGARCFGAIEAKQHGYIDEIGYDRSMAVAALAAKAGLGTDYALLDIRPSIGWGDMFRESYLSQLQFQLSALTQNRWQVCLSQ